jgi:hypothetical protein
LKDLSVDEKLILNMTLRKSSMKKWTGLYWLAMGYYAEAL